MKKGGEENEITISVSNTLKKYSNDFLDNVVNKRINIIIDIVLRLVIENKI